MNEKTCSVPSPTVLRRLSDVLTLSLEGIAQDLGISKSYAHQLRAGQQAMPPKLAWMIIVRYGVHPDCFLEETELLDCSGQPYSRESFAKHQDPSAQTLEGIDEVRDTLDRLFLAAAESGRLPFVLALLRDQIIRLLNALPEVNRNYREQLLHGRVNPDQWKQRLLMRDQEPAELITRDWGRFDLVVKAGTEMIVIEAKSGQK